MNRVGDDFLVMFSHLLSFIFYKKSILTDHLYAERLVYASISLSATMKRCGVDSYLILFGLCLTPSIDKRSREH